MIQSTAIPVLPSVGPLLGAAYDRAVTTVIRSWRVAAILVAIQCLIASIPGIAYSIGNLLLFSWGFFALANAIRLVFDPDFRMTNRTAGEMFAAQLIMAISFIVINSMGVLAITSPQSARAWLLAVPGLIVGTWLIVRWACAPALGARGLPALKALGKSWRLTSKAFWSTFAIPFTNLVVTVAMGFAFGAGAELLRELLPQGFVAISIVAAALLLVGQIYALQANALAICMWLKALQEVKAAEEPAAADAL